MVQQFYGNFDLGVDAVRREIGTFLENFDYDLVLVGGPTAAGTSRHNRLQLASFQERPLLELGMDHYYKQPVLDGVSRGLQGKDYWVNHDHPDTIDFHWLKLNLEHLLSGEVTARPAYTFSSGDKPGYTNSQLVTVRPENTLLIEGLFALHDSELRDMASLKVYIDADPDVSLVRRLERDQRERGKAPEQTALKFYGAGRVLEMCQQFVEPTKEFADIVIRNNDYVPPSMTKERVLGILTGAVKLLDLDVRSVGGRAVSFPKNPTKEELVGILRNARNYLPPMN